MQNESDAFRKMRLRVEEVQGKNCLTNFWVSRKPYSKPAHFLLSTQQHHETLLWRPVSNVIILLAIYRLNCRAFYQCVQYTDTLIYMVIKASDILQCLHDLSFSIATTPTPKAYSVLF